ncbi:ABC transporter permease [Pseudonocardia sp. MH-G8]|uniref:ABC transporter permease n=1 Tax=Pseudonocardia sp. MH-G8 TaxID=1854588 RepID=UPI002101C346|nr:ABC transporter permease [Pseudonocardia sp. MH-G8]
MHTVLRRALAALPTLLGVLVVVFLVVHLIPGDPVRALLGDQATAEQVARTRQDLGLDQPLLSQFLDYLARLLRGDLGVSIASRQPVADQIAARLPSTATLAIAGVLMSVVIGVPLGVLSATMRGRVADLVTLVISSFGVAAPPFWIGILLSTAFAIHLGWLPAIGGGEPGDTGSILRALVLPATALGLSGMALVARMTRSSMLDVLSEDYVRTARAKGLGERAVVYKHGLRNAAIPIVTVIGLNFGHLLGGTIVMETVFARPGIGKLLLDAILGRDYPVVQGVTLVIAVSFVLVNLLTDLTYPFFDPRLKTREEAAR